ncbi:transposase [Candidatus Woesearchaeota archaeon]|nr:transposase [Candidatus Woesearchaeota archaeon]
MEGILDFEFIVPAKKDLVQPTQLSMINAIDRWERSQQKTLLHKTYDQNWTAYNRAQTKEKILCQQLLIELIDLFEEKEVKQRGRPGTPLRDKMFCMFIYTYNNLSSRRIISDIELGKDRFFIEKTPHFNSVLNFFGYQSMTPLLAQLIEITAIPLSQIEQDFAVDSSGFSTSQFERWLDTRLGKTVKKKLWKKAHIMTGVTTNIVTSINITCGTANDSPWLVPVLEKSSKFFSMREISADKAYSTKVNLTAISQAGAIPLIPFKKNATGKAKGCMVWRKMFLFFTEHQDEFLKHYHKRSNVETTFSMIKRKFSHKLSTKKDTAQVNEILMKILCHNLSVLVHESINLGIEIDFPACFERYSAQK